MTIPRRVVPGQVHMISRRCVQRRFLLRPSRSVREIVTYALGLAVTRHAIQLHSVVVESNHYHFVLTDPAAKLPDFERDFDQLVARALNARYGRGEAFWRPGSYSNVELHDPYTIVEKLIYVMTNPVKDGLVERPEDWPGLRTLPEDMGTRRIQAKKPDYAFFGGSRSPDYRPAYKNGKRLMRRPRAVDPLQERHKKKRKRSKLPDVVSFEITVPAAFKDQPLERFHARVRERLEQEVAAIHADRRERGLTRFMGVHAVKTQDPFESAGDTFPAFGRDGRIACLRNAVLRIRLLTALKAWRESYRQARLAWLAGKRNALFPYGTYGLAVYHKARVRSSPRSVEAA